MTVQANKLKRHDRVETLNGWKEVAYTVYYAPTKTIQIVYKDDSLFFCFYDEPIDIKRPKGAYQFTFNEIEFCDYQNPKKFKIKKLLKQVNKN